MVRHAANPNRAQFAPAEPLAERLTHMLLALATELATTRERVDTLEKMLDADGVLKSDSVESFVLDPEAQEARMQRREQFLDRIFEHLQSEIDTAQHSHD
ncbi:MAG: hypothetical protein AB8B96_21060 [Lysobacterales bacterium]